MPCCPGPISSPSVAVGVRWGEEGGAEGDPPHQPLIAQVELKPREGKARVPGSSPLSLCPGQHQDFFPRGLWERQWLEVGGWGNVFKLHVHRHLSVRKACWLGVAGCWTWGHIPLLPAGLWGRHLCGLSSDLPLPPTASAAVGPCTQAFLSWWLCSWPARPPLPTSCTSSRGDWTS